MPERWMGIVVSSDKVIVVDVEAPANGPLVLQGDHSFPLQKGDRAEAYAVMHQQIAEYAKAHKIKRAVIKASALSQGGMKKAHLEAAELRGVVACASAGVAQVKMISKAHMSRTFGDRKVDEYVADDGFWAKEVAGGKLRVGSREAVMALLASRQEG